MNHPEPSKIEKGLNMVFRLAGGLAMLTAVSFLIPACGEQGDERLRKKAALEASEGSRKATEAGNENIRKWSQELESDLTIRQRFFGAVKGTYRGTMTSSDKVFEMKLTLVPSIPAYSSDRIRTIEEVRFDLLNLYFNVQVLSWEKSNTLTAVGCRFEKIWPDLENGQIHLISEKCTNFYSINLYELEQDVTATRDMISRALSGTSNAIAKRILEAKLSRVSRLVGEMQPSNIANSFEFKLKRSGP